MADRVGRPCVRCGRPITAGDEVDLDHRDDGAGWLGLAHSSCNRSAGATRGNRQRGRKLILKEHAIAVEISTDRRHTAIVAAAPHAAGAAFELLDYLDGSDTAAAVADLAADARAVVIDPRSPAATLIGPLRTLGVTVTEPSTYEVAVAHGRFVDEFRAGRLRYVAHPALDAAVQAAELRSLAGSHALERRRVEADQSPLVAAELAVWALLTVEPKRPPKIW